MALLAPAPDYTSRDFDSLRLRPQRLVRSVFRGGSTSKAASFGSRLLELYAFVGDVLAFDPDNQTRKSRIALIKPDRA